MTLFVGIVFANILLLFGMMMSPLLSHYQDEVLEHMLAEYQYVLKAPVEVEEEQAEQYCVTNLKTMDEAYDAEEVTVYGIAAESRYIDEALPMEGIYISDGYAEKYRLEQGDMVLLKEAYGKKTYEFEIKGIRKYPAALAIFMAKEQFWNIFDKEEGYFNGYFSDEELTEIDEAYIASCITEEDLTKLSRQLDVSMGEYVLYGQCICSGTVSTFNLSADETDSGEKYNINFHGEDPGGMRMVRLPGSIFWRPLGW